MEKIAKFLKMCPNCGSEIYDDRLRAGLVCRKCLKEEKNLRSREELCTVLGKELKELRRVCELDAFSEEFSAFFKEKLGFSPWSLQLSWAKRVALKKSFTMIAPTGVGKSTWGLAMASFLKGKSYILVPTKLLVLQTVERLKNITDREVLAYTGKKREKERIERGDFEILITTTNFLYRNFELIPKPFDFVFVDDVDSLLKSARNVDKVIKLLGFEDEDIESASKALEIKRKLAQIAPENERLRQKLLKELKEIEEKIKRRKEEINGVLVVASATSQPRSRRVKLFRELLGFEVGKSASALRNVEDILLFPKGDFLEETVRLIREFGKGVFVFLSESLGKDKVEEVVERLSREGIPSISYEKFTPQEQERFINGEIWAAVGIASYRNPLARGIDLPQAVRYAIFLGVPKLEFSVRLSLSPAKLFNLLIALRELFSEEEKGVVSGYLAYLKRYLNLKEELLDGYPKIKEKVLEIKDFLEEHLKDESFLKKIRESETVSLTEKEGQLFITVADAAGYIQASGRTSRMFAGGLTKGVSLLLVDDLKALNSLRKRLRFYLEEVEFKVLEEEEVAKRLGLPLITRDKLREVFREVDRDRERVRKILAGKLPPQTKELVKSSLVVVESPNKARTIASFFGKPTRRRVGEIDAYEINTGDRLLLITASKGHIFDLTVKEGLWGVEEEEGRHIPVYATIKVCTPCNEQTTQEQCQKCNAKPDIDKITIVSALRELSLEVDELFVASDPDTEGEKIGWDGATVITPYQKNIKRMEFHEITKRAFMEALKNPRDIDESLVKAQIVRRVADRWIGFALSQHLQKAFGKRWLSAGRVQTPVLGWIIEREKESRVKIGIVRAKTEIGEFTFRLEDAERLKSIRGKELRIAVKEAKEEEKNPKPPFNTGELLKEASDRLGLSADRAMELAQELFESGFITYHRTDSTRVSSAGIGVAREYIYEKFSPEFFRPRSWGEGGAHECIRPTRALDREGLKSLIALSGSSAKIEEEHLSLYELIFKRFIASQMRAVLLLSAALEIELLPERIRDEREFPLKVLKEGWNLVEPIEVRELPIEPKRGSEIKVAILELSKEKAPKVYPYTQGELVEEMRRRKIGRPSTYAKIVQTILERRYAVQRGKFLHPTKLGVEVYNYLSQKFPKYTSEEFTRELEGLMEKVEKGEADYQKLLSQFKEITKEVLKR